MVPNAKALLPGTADAAAAAAAAGGGGGGGGGGGVAWTNVPWGISRGSGFFGDSSDDCWDLPVEAVAGVLDMEEQRQLGEFLYGVVRALLSAARMRANASDSRSIK
jgi:hypothetical protein